jgi:hypothetical protein
LMNRYQRNGHRTHRYTLTEFGRWPTIVTSRSRYAYRDYFLVKDCDFNKPTIASSLALVSLAMLNFMEWFG